MKRHQFNLIVREYADIFSVPENTAREHLRVGFGLVREAVLKRGSNVSVPDFGTFRRAKTKGGARVVCGEKVKVTARNRIAFRMSKNLKP